MPTNSLAGAAPSAFFPQLLHIGTGTLGAGAQLRLGDGTRTSLTLSSAGIAVAGNIAATGTMTMAGPLLVTGVQNLTGAGAVDVISAVTLFTSTGAGQALTLANGTHGQIKTIIHAADGGSGVLTAVTKTGWNTYTFTTVGDTLTLQYLTGLGWVVIGFFPLIAYFA